MLDSPDGYDYISLTNVCYTNVELLTDTIRRYSSVIGYFIFTIIIFD